MISSTNPDWAREKVQKFWQPERKLVRSIRDYQRIRKEDGIFAYYISKLYVLRHIFWSIICGADIPLNCNLGGGIVLPHPNGVVIHPSALIGVNCLVHQQVTIGVKQGDSRAPIIGGHVDIGAGAKIIGCLTIGEHAVIGANAVVTKDVPPYAIVAGIPAKLIAYTNIKVTVKDNI